ncbi:RNA dependent RNA polymerase-domain-containing protein [Echria macrotheca]|uniref:RNA-dependent RNA polymerase n=1 Tax=Echria macrotheca TaxID=438768 RepID=A0AAJ0BQI2_9PEZI|nr:RNA dependent RNA polymerase-domain-containing protein [Echria macrotheca]
MNVHLSGLPGGLTDRSLHSQLQPSMQTLSITAFSTSVYRNKTSGNITFLAASDGENFLKKYGALGRSPRLWLMQNPVCCFPSRGPPPTKLALKSIEYQEEKLRSQPQRSEQADITLVSTRLSCGHFAWVNDRFTFVSEWSQESSCTAKFTKYNLIIDIKDQDVQLRIPYQTIVELVWSESGHVAFSLYVPPVILRAAKSIFADMYGSDQDQYERIEAIDKRHQQVSSFCLVYSISVPTVVVGGIERPFQATIGRILRLEMFYVTHFDLGHVSAGGPAFRLRFPDALARLRQRLQDYTQKVILPFDILVLLEALVKNSYLHPTIVLDLAAKLEYMFRQYRGSQNSQPPISVDAFKKLFTWIDYPSPQEGSDPRQFQAQGILDYLVEAERKLKGDGDVALPLKKAPQTMIEVFRAVVTPTRITLHGPELEASNRVLRKFPKHTDYFLRVNFCDEMGEDLFFNPKISLEPIYNRFKKILTNGIPVAGRVYQFLGFSHSSLRSQSAWLLAPFFHDGDLHAADFIIRNLGDFEEIKSPARRAARIGQTFSETPYSVLLEESGIQYDMIPDVERRDSTGELRCFSDGVGTISWEAAEAIWDELPSSKGSPTCFQVRWAGAKGMLSLDTRLSGSQMCIRGSMEKFKSRATNILEICDMSSRPVPMFLNRQLIKLMEDLGIDEQWFLDLQEKELDSLRGITATVFNAAAFLQAKSVGEPVNLSRFIKEAERLGADYRQDPFLRNSVGIVILRELKALKHGARIPVPQGITLFGIMDETGLLKEGEVYVTFDWSKTHSRLRMPQGCRVMVTRSPALHPGDIQLAQHVVPPSDHPLRSLQNCIVFSRHGDRDLPSQLSGGDLDGDLYNVIWDPAVVEKMRTFRPASYARIEPLTVEGPIKVEHMAEFFVEFMRTDRVGVIAIRHLIVADQQTQGTLHPDCLKLAELHSNAVDFSKSGRPVDMRDLPKCDSSRPDFLAPGAWIRVHDKAEIELEDAYIRNGGNDDASGPSHRFYKSNKVLGKLYRAIDELKIWNENLKSHVAPNGPGFWEKILNQLDDGSFNWHSRKEDAQRLRHTYDESMMGLMTSMSDHPTKPLAEFEVFAGVILNKSGKQTSKQRDRSMKLKETFDHIAAQMMQQMRSPAEATIDERRNTIRLCLAGVYVGMGDGASKHSSWRAGTQNLESFKILAASALVLELNALERWREKEGQEGRGFVGVRKGMGRGSALDTLEKQFGKLSLGGSQDPFGGLYPQLRR